jgi:hypothetical protein
MSTNAQDTSQVIGSLIGYYPESVLYTLLKDRTTHRGIIWADNSYAAFQSGFGFSDSITPLRILNRKTGKFNNLIHLRATKKMDSKSQRTRSHAEVFSPSWLVNRMNNALDRIWFGRDNVFTTPMADGRKWKATSGRISFPQSSKNDQKGENKSWSAYVMSPRLEIACGEAPFLCSRYDVTTGEPIAVPERIGILDRKLRVVSENTSSPQDWDTWALKALQATYGYEYQGDNLLIARINVLETLVEHREDRWSEEPDKTLMSKAARIVSWNLWQMDGLTDSVPAKKQAKSIPMDIPDSTTDSSQENTVSSRLSKIYDWQQNKTLTFRSLKRQGGTGTMKKFYAVIGNPPYQEESVGDQKTYQKPIYNDFLDAAYTVSDRVEMVHPGRFLFNAGSTPKAWNRKMLADPHVTVLEYEADSRVFFPQQDIK